jgi:hypothetical protein
VGKRKLHRGAIGSSPRNCRAIGVTKSGPRPGKTHGLPSCDWLKIIRQRSGA